MHDLFGEGECHRDTFSLTMFTHQFTLRFDLVVLCRGQPLDAWFLAQWWLACTAVGINLVLGAWLAPLLGFGGLINSLGLS